MHKFIRHFLLAALIAGTTATAEAESPAAKTPNACSLLTLEDAKSLLGSGTTFDTWSKEDYCSYSLERDGFKNAVTLSVFRGSNKLWEDTVASGEKISGLGDESYFQKMIADWVVVLGARKGEMILLLNVRDHTTPRDAVKAKELAVASTIVSRLSTLR